MKRLAAFAISVPLLLAQAGREGVRSVTEVRHWGLSEATRVSVQVSGDFEFRYARLHNPERIYFDILNARPSIQGRPSFTETLEDRLLSRIRVATNAPDVTRVVLDVADGTAVSASRLTDPDRLMIELRREGATPAPVETASQPKSNARPAPPSAPAGTASASKSGAAGPAPASARTTVPMGQPPAETAGARNVAQPASVPTSAAGSGKPAARPSVPQTNPTSPAGAAAADRTRVPDLFKPPARVQDASADLAAAKAALADPALKPPEDRAADAAAPPSRITAAPAGGAKPAAPPSAGKTAPAVDAVKTDVPAVAGKSAGPVDALKSVAPVETAKAPAPTEAPKSTEPVEIAKAAKRTSAGGSSLVRALGLKLDRVVIDPGHGGHDQGTAGPHGLLEKDVVLDVAERLGELIGQRMGADVVYTRTDDTFIPLQERTAIANEKKADLFLSIHANSSPVAPVAGIETFYLSLNGTKYATDVAARENASFEKSVFDLPDLVQQIAKNDKAQESKEFATRVQAALFAFSAKNVPGSKDRGVKSAPFVVLIGAHMPSILTEIGFLTNPKEEGLLKKPAYRQQMAEAIYKGVNRYAESLSHFQTTPAATATAAAKAGGRGAQTPQ
jgi:N-acetylmuramoyl-L-alanine amidase